MDRGGTLLVISDQPEPFSAGFHAQQWASLLAPDTGYTKKVDFVTHDVGNMEGYAFAAQSPAA
jgi:hypothetical protein